MSEPLFITAENVDPELVEPYVDLDVARTMADPAGDGTLSYRYVHGGFVDTKVRFSFYFPEPAEYRGRFFQYTYPTLTEEDATPGTVAFAVSNGAYAVSTNNGGGIREAGALAGYRINAAAAKHAKVIAAQIYGADAPTRGYIHGASGGAFQTLGAMENTSGVWAGGVPMVPGPPNAIPSFMASQVLGLRVLRDRLADIADSLDAGGSGDPYATLDAEQTAALQEVTRLGFPLRAWWQHAHLDGGAFPIVAGGVRMIDPSYVEDFWNTPGYAGADPADPVRAARLQFDTSVEAIEIMTGPATVFTDGRTPVVTLSEVPNGALTCADLIVTSGDAVGRIVPVGAVDGSTIAFGGGTEASAADGIQPGDSVRIDNSWVLALQHYQRHQVPTPDQYGWNQYRNVDGTPTYPQRSLLIGPMLAAGPGGAVANGRFHGKMIMLGSVLDADAFPWAVDWYRARATEVFGDSLDERYRVWFTDNANHEAPKTAGAGAHIVSYDGVLQQALLDLDDWVANEISPPASTEYHVDDQSQVIVASTAAQRCGIQPVVRLTATTRSSGSGSEVVRVDVGESATFTVEADVPSGTGAIVQVEWDFENSGDFVGQTVPDPVAPTVRMSTTHAFTRPGTHFVVARVTSQRDGNPTAPYGRIQNLARVRVIVD